MKPRETPVETRKSRVKQLESLIEARRIAGKHFEAPL